jgi:hypothetical protein
MFAFAIFAAAALAPPPSSAPPEGEPIVVTGNARPALPVARSFVHDVTQRSFDQVARYHDPLCPVVLGLADSAARVVRDRILETAAGIGADVAPDPRCAANLILVVDDDGRQFVKDLRRQRPDWLAGLGAVDIGNLINQSSPARAWSVTSLRDEDGLNAVIPDYGDAYTMNVKSASILKLPTRAQIEASIILIDRSAAVGITLAQLADYAAMRGLARTVPPKAKGVRTILNLFEPGAPREPELTRSDILYLQALYRSAGTESAVQQSGRLAHAIHSDSARGQTGP